MSEVPRMTAEDVAESIFRTICPRLEGEREEWIAEWADKIRAAEAVAHREGAEEMRKRAADHIAKYVEGRTQLWKSGMRLAEEHARVAARLEEEIRALKVEDIGQRSEVNDRLRYVDIDDPNGAGEVGE